MMKSWKCMYSAKCSQCSCQSNLAKSTTCSVTRLARWRRMISTSSASLSMVKLAVARREKKFLKVWRQSNQQMAKISRPWSSVSASAMKCEWPWTSRLVWMSTMVSHKTSFSYSNYRKPAINSSSSREISSRWHFSRRALTRTSCFQLFVQSHSHLKEKWWPS